MRHYLPARKVHAYSGADIRVGTLRRLLGEIGLDADQAAIVHCPPEATAGTVKNIIDNMVQTLADKTAVTS